MNSRLSQLIGLATSIIVLLTGCAAPSTFLIAAAAGMAESSAVEAGVETEAGEAAGAETTSAEIVEAPAQEIHTMEEIWNREDGYAEPERCPPGLELNDSHRPFFGPVGTKEVEQDDEDDEVEQDDEDDVTVPVQRGIYVNEDGEFFSIEVAGASQETGAGTVDYYTYDLRVCFDRLTSNGVGGFFTALEAAQVNEPQAGSETEPSLDSEPDPYESLVIKMAFEGAVAVDGPLRMYLEERGETFEDYRSSLEEYINELGEAPTIEELLDASLGQLDNLFGVEHSLNEGSQQGYMVDFIIDPSIERTTHQYQQPRTRGMWVSVSVKNGSVNAGLCKLNSTTVHTSKTVAYGSEALPDTDTISVFEGDRLGVRGMDSINKYRLDGRWGVVTFGATAPSENTRACNG